MSFQIMQSSPLANAEAEKLDGKLAKYPFDDLNVGQSFTAGLDDVNWKSLRTCVYQRNSREVANGTGRVFKFIKHDDLKVCEVARIA